MPLSREARREVRDRHRAANDDVYQRELAAARAYKRRQRGTCERCGRATRYNGRDGKVVGRFCRACQAIRGGEFARTLRGSGQLQRDTLELISDGERRFIEIRDALGISDGHTSVHLNRMLRYGLIVRVKRGVYRVA